MSAAPVLREIVDEGIRVFERCSASARGGDENIGLLFPFLQLIEVLDGVEIALDNASATSASILLRAAFEALLTVEWISKDLDLRYGAAYIVCYIKRRIATYGRFSPKHSQRDNLIAALRNDRSGKGVRVPILRDGQDRIKDLEVLLLKPHLREASLEYTRTAAVLKREPDFYALWNGPRAFQQLAQKLGKSAEYEIMYRPWSRMIHAEDVERHLTILDGEPAIRVFRTGERMQECYTLGMTYGLEAIRAMLRHYRPDELDRSFQRWYSTHICRVYQRLAQN